MAKNIFMSFLINMLTITSTKFNTPSFGAFFNEIKDEDGKIIYRGDTRICRDDLDFPAAIDFLDKKYKNVPKVNVIMHACSDGEEVYSFIGVLVAKLGENAEKFLPIKAKDIDANHLKLAKRGVYNVTRTEYIMANDYMLGNFYNFFDFLPHKISTDPRLRYTTTIKANEYLKSLVNFGQGNIIDDMKRVSLKDTVLFARNFWPYLTMEESRDLISTISKNADKSFTLVIGDYDKEFGFDKLLKSAGFVETEVENVFEKQNNAHHDNLKDVYDYPNYYLYNL